MLSETDEYIRELTQKKGLPYVDVVAYKDHEQIYRYFCGDGREKITGKEKLYMYSATKPVTAVCAMKLWEDGLISFDDKITKWLPEYGEAYVRREDGTCEKCGADITVLNLLTMTSGGFLYTSQYPIKETIAENGGKEDTRTIVKAFPKVPLIEKPGVQFNYGLSHDILAAIIEQVSGKKFSEYAREKVFEPLGMQNSTFDYLAEGICTQYNADENGKMTKVTNTAGEHWFAYGKEYESGGAGLVSTVEDYAIFADALACGGAGKHGRILKPETVRQFSKERLENLVVKNDFTCYQGVDYGYGLGVRVRTKPTEWGLPKGEFGWDGAAGSYVMVDPVNHISVFIGLHIGMWIYVFLEEHLNIVKKIYENVLNIKQ
ncbi:MAG: beta-lactamase family protein [Clostridia bacterium]|nr:beta-lactamase family protein [Clostridia bacterium]